MNNIISQAIADYNTAAKECTKLNQAAKAAQEAHSAAVNKIREVKTFKEWKNSPEYIEMERTAEEAAKMEKRAKAATAIKYAAAQNAAQAAANAILEAMEAGTDKRLFLPTHYKKFDEAIKDITGPEFYISHNSEYSIYITFRDGDYGHSEIYLFDKKTGEVDPEYIERNRGKHRKVYALTEIKADAKKAAKAAAKIRDKAEKLQKESEALKNEINSSIKWLMPSINYTGLNDSRLLF